MSGERRGRHASAEPRDGRRPRPRRRWTPPTWREVLLWLGVVLACVAALSAVAAWSTGHRWLSLPLAAVPLGGVVWLSLHDMRVARDRRRRLDLLAAWAMRHGWTLRQRDPRLRDRWDRAPTGVPGELTEVLHGRVHGRPVVSFLHTAQASDRRPPVPSHVIAVDLPVTLPDLSLLIETTVSTVADAVGVRDLQVESAAFNRARRIVCDDPRYAHAVLHPRAMDLLLTGPLRDLPVRIAGSALLVWAPGPTDVDQVLPRVDALIELAGTIPRHVLDDHGGRRGRSTTPPRGCRRERARADALPEP